MSTLTIGEAIRRIRKRLGKNTRDFAALVKSTSASISRYENGKLMPGAGMAQVFLSHAETVEERAAIEEFLNPQRATGNPPAAETHSDNLIFQIRQAARLSVATFADQLGVGQLDVAGYEAGDSIPPPPVVKLLQQIATKAGRADLALVLTSDDWQVRAVFHPGEHFISTGKTDNVPNRLTEKEEAIEMLEEIYDSGMEDARVAVYQNLLVFRSYVRARRKSPVQRKHAQK